MIIDARIEDWTAEEYFASDAVSRSDLCDVLESPATYEGRRSGALPGIKETPAMRFGTAVHLAVFEPEEAARRFVTEKKFSGKGSVAARAEWSASLADDAMVWSAEDLARIEGCRSAVLAHPVARVLLGEGADELSVSWTEEGMRCRARLDKVRMNARKAFIADLKTSTDPSPEAFSKKCANYGYDMQAVWYPRALPSVLGIDSHRFAFVVVRSSAPFEVAVYRPDEDFLRLGEAKVRRAMELIKRCTESKDWSAPWQQQVNTLSAPRWALKAEGL